MTDDGQRSPAAAAVPPGYRNQWSLFEIHCADVSVAARFAARQNWWLHCWTHIPAAHDEPRMIVVGEPHPPWVEVPDDGRTPAHRLLRTGRSPSSPDEALEQP